MASLRFGAAGASVRGFTLVSGNGTKHKTAKHRKMMNENESDRPKRTERERAQDILQFVGSTKILPEDRGERARVVCDAVMEFLDE